MKKLIIATLALCAAVATQAATIQWSSGLIYKAASKDGGFSSVKIGALASASLFTLTAADYTSYLSAYENSGNMSAVWKDYEANKFGTATQTGTTGSRNNMVTLNTTANVGDTVYGAIIYTYTDASLDNAKFYIANIGVGTVGSDMGITINNLALYYTGGDASTGTSMGGWSPVPEPTSGLLLLLGFAGLALKRKNA